MTTQILITLQHTMPYYVDDDTTILQHNKNISNFRKGMVTMVESLDTIEKINNLSASEVLDKSRQIVGRTYTLLYNMEAWDKHTPKPLDGLAWIRDADEFDRVRKMILHASTVVEGGSTQPVRGEIVRMIHAITEFLMFQSRASIQHLFEDYDKKLRNVIIAAGILESDARHIPFFRYISGMPAHETVLSWSMNLFTFGIKKANDQGYVEFEDHKTMLLFVVKLYTDLAMLLRVYHDRR